MRKFYPVTAGTPVELLDPNRRIVRLMLDIVPFWPFRNVTRWKMTAKMPEEVAATILIDGGVDVELDERGEACFEAGELSTVKTTLVAYYKGTDTRIERIWI